MSDLKVRINKEKILKDILKDVNILETKGSLEVKVKGVEIDSRGVKESFAFFAANGYVQKGSKFIPSAIEKGASVIFIEADENIEEIEGIKETTIIKVDNVRKALGYVSRNFYDDPSKEMTVIGITGTKGKSTSTFMVKKILEEAGYTTCLVGSIGGFVGSEKISDNTRTTPDSYVIQEILAEAKENYGATHAVIEVSSQAMILERVTGITFKATAFTNFSEDHISKDEHPTLKDYYEAKIKAVKLAKINVLNVDDIEVKKALNYLPESNTKYTFAIENDSDVKAIEESIILTEEKIEFDVVDKEKEENTHMSLVIPGRFSIYNALTAITISHKVLGIDLNICKEALKNARVLGRLEPVPNKLGLNILLDYAHTASSLENILKAVTSYAKGKVICAWGVGGNRDAAKRPVMGRISGKYADFTILMSDQIRFEDPLKILKDIEVGLKEVTDNYEIYVDRKEGIKRAIEIAKKEDTIIIPGFGHDMYQEINGVKHPFDERKVITEIIDKLIKEGMTK